jgi:hypothetical protein
MNVFVILYGVVGIVIIVIGEIIILRKSMSDSEFDWPKQMFLPLLVALSWPILTIPVFNFLLEFLEDTNIRVAIREYLNSRKPDTAYEVLKGIELDNELTNEYAEKKNWSYRK